LFLGTFEAYDPIKDPLAPVCKGFSAGKWQDGNELYVGLGKAADDCSSEEYDPGRIVVEDACSGVMVECWSNDHSSVLDAKYLRYHPKLAWKLASTSNPVANALYTTSSEGHLIHYGRKNFTNFVAVSKAMVFSGKYKFFYHVNGATHEATSGFEVLTCDP
jgi:hypothetical protein